MRIIALALLSLGILLGQSPHLHSNDGLDKFLGELSADRFDPDSISNPFGRYGHFASPDSVNNPWGRYGSRFSPYSATNPFTTHGPKIVTSQGRYLGNYSANTFDPNVYAQPRTPRPVLPQPPPTPWIAKPGGGYIPASGLILNPGPPGPPSSYPVPKSQQLIRGADAFLQSFQQARNREKTAARRRLLDMLELKRLGLPIDQEQLRREIRKAGLIE